MSPLLQFQELIGYLLYKGNKYKITLFVILSEVDITFYYSF